MQTQALSYLLALDIFVLITLIMAVGPIVKVVRGPRKRLILALFFLFIIRSISLIGFLWHDTLAVSFIGTIEILSILCIIWALLKPSVFHLSHWRIYAQTGLGLVLLFCLLLWFTPSLPWQGIAAPAAFCSLIIIFSRWDKARWSHAIPPIALGIAVLLDWGSLTRTSQFIMLLGYGSLVYAVFVETAINADSRQQEVTTLGAEAQRNRLEQVQFMAVSNQLSAAPNPNDLSDHAVQTMGQATGVDQVVLLAFNKQHSGQGNVAAVYRPSNTSNYLLIKETSFAIPDYPLLIDALESQRPITVTAVTDQVILKKLYALWQHPRIGPTLIQPLFLKHKAVGVLILGNCVSQALIKGSTVRLCHKLSSQLATMVAYHQEHQLLLLKIENMAVKLQLKREEYKQLANIVETMNEGIIASNTAGRIHLVNKAAEQLIGKSREQILGQSIGNIYGDIASRKSIEKLATEFSRSNQTLPTYFERNGQAVQGKLIPLRNKHQEWMGVLAVLRDVTTEAGTVKAKSEFTQLLFRELRAPLTTIKSYLDLMLTGVVGRLDGQQRHFIHVVKTSTDRIEKIINDKQSLLDNEADMLKLNLKKVDIEKVIEATRHSVSALIVTKNLNFTLDLPSGLPSLQADEARLRQILEQLVSNACRFTREAGTISLRAWMQTEGLNGHQSQYLIISIADDGIGIPTKAQGQIFEPYFQVPNELSDIAGGLGLGLSIVKDLVEAHGGRIWVESEEGKGSVFQIALPYTLN